MIVIIECTTLFIESLNYYLEIVPGCISINNKMFKTDLDCFCRKHDVNK